MEYFNSLTQSDLIELINSAKNDLFICLPSIHKELADAIISLPFSTMSDENKMNIHMVLDFDAQTFRQGYGDCDSVENLIKRGYDVRTLKDNRISFIISDNVGYYLFIESRSLIPADKETVNAVRIDPVSLVRLKKFFFSSAINMEFEDELTNAIIEESRQLEKAKELLTQQIAPVESLSDKIVSEVAADLKNNPPLNPDYKRIVEFYSNKFQYTKLRFEGSNLQHRKIIIPSKALPISDAALKERLETKLNLFDATKVEDSFKVLQDLKNQVTKIREKYLTKVKSREESLLSKQNKNDFQSAICALNTLINKTKSESLLSIANQIADTKDRLLGDLADFLRANPKALFPDRPDLQANDNYIESESKVRAEGIIHKKIYWPKAHDLIDEFKIDVQFSDITFEDLKNKQFVTELKKSGLINLDDENQLAEFSKGIGTK